MPNGQARRAFAWGIAASIALTALIAALGPRLASVAHLPDKGAAWYYWQSDPATRTFWTRATPWIGYGLHQLAIWLVVVLMMREKPHAGRISKLNAAALAINGLFILLHILQTHLWYDGTAQAVPVWSSQLSVIVMLVIILYQATPMRGLFLGKKLKWNRDALAWSYKWHGLYISWALVYTFWFHPAEGQYGLLIGFFYMFLLLLQLSLANTEVHLSLPWIAILELMVGLHGPLIAVQKMLSGNEGEAAGAGIWIMFAAGFLFMFAFTGQYSFKLPKWARAAIIAAYAALVGILYAWRGLGKLYEIAFIPAALYGGTFALAALARLASMLGAKSRKAA
jgi:hypothetical protein